jgi:hypothetical protein
VFVHTSSSTISTFCTPAPPERSGTVFGRTAAAFAAEEDGALAVFVVILLMRTTYFIICGTLMSKTN